MRRTCIPQTVVWDTGVRVSCLGTGYRNLILGTPTSMASSQSLLDTVIAWDWTEASSASLAFEPSFFFSNFYE